MGNGCESDETFCGPARLRPCHPSITPCYDHMRQQIQEENMAREDAHVGRIATAPAKNQLIVEVDATHGALADRLKWMQG
ncbi:unnamed protein product [Haemonchus placei]|uniref:Uncharacterized protein n=1 Tax=Haemonchus placei TaxID=6290 RepID=A0A0N4WZS5_HAEPC|nr:unnamed protein product [Haemonchus placei]